jgi:SecD/SecF fusion protein
MRANSGAAQWLLALAVTGAVALVVAQTQAPPAPAPSPSVEAVAPDRVRLVLQADLMNVPVAERPAQVGEVVQVIERRVQAAGLPAASVQQVGPDRVRIELPADADVQGLTDLLTGRGAIDFREQVPLPDGNLGWQTARARGADGQEQALSSQYFTQVTPSADANTNRPIVLFELNPEGQRLLAALTGRLVDQRLGIFVDDELYVALTVRDPITGGRGQITGQFTADGARTLAIQLTAGELPVPVQLVPERIS